MKTELSPTTSIDISILGKYKRLKFLVVGDVMLDHYIQADVERTSPEAPVIVASVQSEHYIPGGAANVAANLKAMGANVLLAGIIGNDKSGDVLSSLLEEKGIGINILLTDPDRSTTLKTRIMARGQQILRIDREVKTPVGEKFIIQLKNFLRRNAGGINGIIISDYAKGLCTKELLEPVIEFAKRHGITTVCDPKGNDFSKYRGVDILTPNFREVQEATNLSIKDNKTLERAAQKLIRITGSKAVVVTRGAEGVSLFINRKPPIHIPTHAQEVYDVTGAGDTFISHFSLAHLAGLPYRQAAHIANFASAIVVGKLGVAVVSPEELVSFIRTETFGTKIKTLEELVEIIKGLKAGGKKVIFTNGCFDLIHIGHIKFLQEARSLGDCLIVGINTDASVRKVKGPGRPLIGENERADLLAALHWVDYVVLFDETTPEPMLRALKPDILVKGKNLRPEEIVGFEIVKDYGGEVRRLPFFSNISTSERLKDILKTLKNK